MKHAAKLCLDPHTGRMRPRIDEDAEQEVIVEWLERRGVEFHHSPNGGARPSKVDKAGRRFCVEGQKLKRLGTRPGFSDLIILDPPPKWSPKECAPTCIGCDEGEPSMMGCQRPPMGAFIEMKALDGDATPDQVAFMKRREAQGWPCCIARGANVAIAFLTE